MRIQLRFDAMPGPEGARLIEVENLSGHSIAIGEWVKDGDQALLLLDVVDELVETARGGEVSSEKPVEPTAETVEREAVPLYVKGAERAVSARYSESLRVARGVRTGWLGGQEAAEERAAESVEQEARKWVHDRGQQHRAERPNARSAESDFVVGDAYDAYLAGHASAMRKVERVIEEVANDLMADKILPEMYPLELLSLLRERLRGGR